MLSIAPRAVSQAFRLRFVECGHAGFSRMEQQSPCRIVLAHAAARQDAGPGLEDDDWRLCSRWRRASLILRNRTDAPLPHAARDRRRGRLYARAAAQWLERDHSPKRRWSRRQLEGGRHETRCDSRDRAPPAQIGEACRHPRESGDPVAAKEIGRHHRTHHHLYPVDNALGWRATTAAFLQRPMLRRALHQGRGPRRASLMADDDDAGAHAPASPRRAACVDAGSRARASEV